MKIIVTGASGFLGSYLVSALLSLDYKVCGIARNFPGLLSQSIMNNPNFLAHSADITDINQILPVFNSAEFVYHLACGSLPHTSNDNPYQDVYNNVNGSLNVLEASRVSSIGKFIFVSSGGTVYGLPRLVPIPETHSTEPLCSYGITKLSIEKYIGLYNHLYGLKSFILRVSNPYGARQRQNSAQGVIPIFMRRAMQCQALKIMGDGSIVRDFIYITDLISALLALLTYNGSEKVFNVGSGQGLSLSSLVNKIEMVLDRRLTVEYMNSRNFDVPTNILSIDKARIHLGWSPKVTIEEGLRCLHENFL